MDGLLFLAAVAAIGVLMWWVRENDNPDPRAPTRGPFAMRDGLTVLSRRARRLAREAGKARGR